MKNNLFKKYTLFLDSRKANFKKNNLEFAFILNTFGSYPSMSYSNVASVELTALTFFNGADGSAYSITSDLYFIIEIDELNNRIHSNVPNANNAFAIIYKDNAKSTLNTPTTTMTSEESAVVGHAVQKVKGQDFDKKIRVFDPPLGNLNRFSVKIRPYDEETHPLNTEYQGYFTFLFNIVAN